MNKKGFTLMELLAVVMIIGILTAVALPQYRKVVAKSRFTKAQVMAKSIYDSCQRLIAEWGVDYYTDVPRPSDGWRISRLDIGSEDLLPRGYVINTDGVITGGDFQYSIQNNCNISINQISGDYAGTFIFYNGVKFNNCNDNGTGACDVYNVD